MIIRRQRIARRIKEIRKLNTIDKGNKKEQIAYLLTLLKGDY